MKLSSLSSFVSYDLTDPERALGFEYTDFQIACLQNELAACAEQLLQVALEVEDISLEGVRKLAYTKGQIDILKYLLGMSESIKQDKLAELKAQESGSNYQN